MPRRGTIKKRKLKPDHLYNSTLISRFVRTIMGAGKKSTAEKIVYGSMERVKEMSKSDPLKMFEKAIENVHPFLETKSRRVGGATYQVPVEVRADRQVALSIRWLVDAARERPERTMLERLANELSEAGARQGVAVKRKDDMHRMAEANKAFAHYRW